MKYEILNFSVLGVTFGCAIGYCLYKRLKTIQLLIIDRELYHNKDLDITIGVSKFHDENQPLSNQYIKVNNKLHHLKNFYKNDHYLSFIFDKNISLMIIYFGSVIMIYLFDNGRCILCKPINELIIKRFKKMNFNSEELDYIYDLLNKINE